MSQPPTPSVEAPNTLTASGLTRSYGNQCLYKEIAVSLHRGELLALVGPNGAGKSSLLRDLAGLTPVSHGQVTLGKDPLDAWPLKHRAQILAYLPQQTPVDPELLVIDVVSLGRAPYWRPLAQPTPADQRAIAGALEAVGITSLQQRSVGSLSGGERKRVMLARMLATQAAFCLLDEPTAALDIGHAIDFLALCRSLCTRKIGMLIALHDLDLARQFADRVVLLHADRDGTATVGTVAQVLTPERIGEVFGVQTRLLAGHLVFSPRREDR